MNKIEIIANELAFLNNSDMLTLAQILVRDYPTRADVLETQLNAAFFYKDVDSNREKQYE